jgi:predicted NAD/FAD-dependent oxidoreductase
VAISNAAPNYATRDRVLISSSVLGVHHSSQSEAAVRKHLSSLYKISTTTWQHVATYPIPDALPAMNPPHEIESAPKFADGIYLAGDYRAVSSINGAFLSGRKAAEAVLAEIL